MLDLQRQTDSCSGRFGIGLAITGYAGGHVGILNEIDEARVITEVHVAKFRMSANAHVNHDQPFEIGRQIVGQIECAQFCLGQRIENR